MIRSVFLLFLALIPPASGATFTLDTAVAYAVGHNPDLAAARFSIEEARGRLTQSGRLPNPELESELKPNVRGREFSFGVGFTQRFPLTDRLRLERAVSGAEFAAAEAEVRAAEQRLAFAVRTVGVKYLSLGETRSLKERQIANSQELAAAAAKLAARAEGSALEAAQFDLEARQLSLDLLQLDAERTALAGEARPLLGVPAEEAVAFSGTLPGVADPGNAAPDVKARGDYQAAQARIESARQGVSLAKANRWEDAGVGLAAEVDRAEDAPDGLKTDGLIGIRFTLPLPFWNKNEGRIQEAEAGVQRAEKEAEALAATVRAEAAAARAEMAAARRILEEMESGLLPKAREIESMVSTFYQQAQPGAQLADVLRAREKRLALELSALDARRSWHLAHIRYEAAMGRLQSPTFPTR